jgi:hypothetical protein
MVYPNDVIVGEPTTGPIVEGPGHRRKQPAQTAHACPAKMTYRRPASPVSAGKPRLPINFARSKAEIRHITAQTRS